MPGPHHITDLTIVACGPSAADRIPKLRHVHWSLGTIVGINRVVDRLACDWWVFSDRDMFDKARPLGVPHIFARKLHIRQIDAERPGALEVYRCGGFVLAHEEISEPPIDDCRCFSGPAALLLAWHLRPKRITLVGFDMMGDLDCRGEYQASRTQDRWELERRVMTDYLRLFVQHNITVNIDGDTGHTV